MKVTITYKESHQISQDDFDVHTEVVYLEPSMTLYDVHQILTNKRINKKFDGEIHFTPETKENG